MTQFQCQMILWGIATPKLKNTTLNATKTVAAAASFVVFFSPMFLLFLIHNLHKKWAKRRLLNNTDDKKENVNFFDTDFNLET